MVSALQTQLNMKGYVKATLQLMMQEKTNCGLCRRTHGKLKRNSNRVLK